MWSDLRLAFRSLSRSPRFALVSAGSIGLGIAASTAIFSFVYSILLAPLPFPDSERIVAVNEFVRQRPAGGNPQRLADYRQAAGLQAIAGYYSESITFVAANLPERIRSLRTFGDILATLGIQPALGRGFTPAEMRGAGVALISDSLWRSRFQSSPEVLARRIILDGAAYQIIGVLPSTARFEDAEVFLPDQDQAYPRGARFLSQIARLRPGVSLLSAQAQIGTVVAGLEKQYPATDSEMAVRLRPLREELGRPASLPLMALLGAVCFVVLMASVNVANLFLARASGRRSEIAVRVALGASRWTIARMLFAETLTVAAIGGILGLLGTVWSVDALRALAPADLPRLEEVRVSWPVAAFAALLTIACAVVSGVLPSWRSSVARFGDSLRRGARSTGSTRALQQALIGAQLAFSLALTIGGGLLFRTLWNLENRPLGFSPDNVLTFRLSLSWQTGPDQLAAIYNRIIERTSTLPGITGVALVDSLPFGGGSQSGEVVIGAGQSPAPSGSTIGLRAVSAGYHRLMRVPLFAGRFLEDSDSAHRRTLINQSAARAYFPHANPIGQTIGIKWDGKSPSPDRLYEIVGVTGDLPDASREQAAPAMFVPFGKTFWPLAWFVVRTSSNPAEAANAVRSAVASADPGRAVEFMQSLNQFLDKRNRTERLEAWLVGVFAVLALALAAVGVFGMVAAAVAERKLEIGIRMALGASPLAVVRETISGTVIQLAAGLAAGLALSLALTRAAKGLLFGIEPADPATYAAAALLLTGIALLAAWLPARRAALLDPAAVLRRDS